MRAFAAVALFITSALSLAVIQPAPGTIWDITPTHFVSWSSVSTDRANFSIVLVNEQVNPTYSQLLEALVPTNAGNTTVNAPASGWPVGSGFQINFVQDANNLNAILAQSQNLTIQVSSTSASSSTPGLTLTGSSTTLVGNTPSGNPSSLSSTSTSPTASRTNNAVGGMNVQTVFVAAVALLGAALA